MFETETVGPCLVQKLKWGGTWPPCSPSPQWLRSSKFQLFWFSPTGNYNRCVWNRPVTSSFAAGSLPVFIDFFRSLGLSSFSPGICCFLYWINLWFEDCFIRFTKLILLTYYRVVLVHDTRSNDSRFMHKLCLSLHARGTYWREGNKFHRIENFTG